MATVGTSFEFATTMSKVFATVPPLPSSAITSMDTVPTSPFAGVPLKVLVMESKFNHVGNAPPPASCAE